MSELRDRLEALAARGSRRGAEDVLNAARRDAKAGGADVTATGDGAATAADDEGLPLVTFELGSPRRRFRSLVAAVGVAALVGVGALAVTAITGSGGAGSPEGAVRQLADAITHKDPLAAVDVLVPSEVRSLRETVKSATQRAADLQIVSDASQPLAGVDLSVDHLELTTQTLADGYAKVVITSGEISASTHRAQLSALLQKALRDKSGDTNAKADLSKLASDSSGLPTFVVVVRQDGGWYVSPAYTALEYAREANDGPAAAFGSAHAADLGADSPGAAVSDALHAWQASNWDRVLALAPPDELPVYDYRGWIDQTLADTHPDFSIDTLSTTATVDGDMATVALSASGTFGPDHSSWQVGGNCPSINGSISSTPSDRNRRLCFAGDLAGLPFLRVTGSTGDTAATGPVSISVVRESGRWFVSPVTTVLNVLNSTIEHLDQRTVYTVLGLAYELPPDATITLDQPFQPATSRSLFSSQVYAFDGTAGQQVVGTSDAPNSPQTTFYASGEVFTADGDNVGSVDFGPYPTSVKLPRTGSYRLVLNDFGLQQAGGTTLTLWDLADAPQSVRDRAASNGETCTGSGGFFFGGSTSCTSSSASAVTPTTGVGNPGSSGSPNPLGSCTVTGNTLKCSGSTQGGFIVGSSGEKIATATTARAATATTSP